MEQLSFDTILADFTGALAREHKTLSVPEFCRKLEELGVAFILFSEALSDGYEKRKAMEAPGG